MGRGMSLIDPLNQSASVLGEQLSDFNDFLLYPDFSTGTEGANHTYSLLPSCCDNNPPLQMSVFWHLSWWQMLLDLVSSAPESVTCERSEEPGFTPWWGEPEPGPWCLPVAAVPSHRQKQSAFEWPKNMLRVPTKWRILKQKPFPIQVVWFSKIGF